MAVPIAQMTSRPQNQVRRQTLLSEFLMTMSLLPTSHLKKNQVSTAKAESASSSTYGPLRRVRQKDGPPALYRPPAMHADDFAEMMREVVPQLLEEATQSIDQSMHPKRRLENPDSSDEPAGHRPRTGSASEVLSVQDVNHLSEMMTDDSTSIETLVAHYMQRHNTKEMPPCNKSSRGSTIG